MTPEQSKMQELQKELDRLRKVSEAKEPKDDLVVIKGNKPLKWLYSVLYKIFNKIAENYEEKKLKYENKQFKLKEFKFESPRLIFIIFTDILADQDYEVVLHSETGYLNYWKEYQETKKIPQLMKIDRLIKNKYKTAVKI